MTAPFFHLLRMETWGHILLCSFSHIPLANPISNTFSFSFRTWPKSDHSSLQPLRSPSADYSYFSPRIASKNVSLLPFLGASNSVLNTAAKVILLKPKSDHDTLCSKFITTFPLHSDLKQIERFESSWTPFGWVGPWLDLAKLWAGVRCVTSRLYHFISSSRPS